MEIINNIIAIMNKKGITAYKLEKETGIKQQTFQGWKNGHKMSVSALEQIIKYLEVSPNDIFGYKTNNLLSENETELLKYFNLLPEREQIKFIGRIEDAAEKYIDKECQSSNSKIG